MRSTENKSSLEKMDCKNLKSGTNLEGIAHMPAEIMTNTLEHVLASSPVLLTWNGQGNGGASFRMPEQALAVALTCERFRDYRCEAIRTMVFQNEARLSDLAAPYQFLHRIQTIILEGGHGIDVDIGTISSLRSIICRGGDRYKVLIDNGNDVRTTFPNPKTPIAHRIAIQSQSMHMTPKWLCKVVANRRTKIEVEV